MSQVWAGPKLFMKIPAETLISIIDAIDERNDLLSLALTCRMLCEMIIPHHTDFFEIRCHYQDPFDKLWHFLSQQPNRCKRVRILKFLNTSEPVLVPRQLFDYNGYQNDNEQSPMLLYEALSMMSNLRCIIVDFCNVSEGYIHNVSNALQKSGCALKELRVKYGRGLAILYPGPGITHMEPDYAGITLFSPNVSQLSTLSLHLGWLKEEEFDYICQLLRNSTNLTHLNIGLDHPENSIDVFLQTMLETCQWSKLEELTVRAPTESPQFFSRFPIFYQRHTRLITLNFYFPLVPGFFPDNSGTIVTSLRSMYMKGRARDILPEYISRNLVHLTLCSMSDTTFEEIDLPSLKSCVLPVIVSDKGLPCIERFVRAAPNVQKCWISANATFKPIRQEEEEIRKIASLLRPLTNLTHLMGLFGAIDLTEPSGFDLFRSLDELPTVAYADARVNGRKHQIVRLTRYWSNPTYYEVIHPPRSSCCFAFPDLSNQTWGGFF